MHIPARYIFILSLLLALVATPHAVSAFSISATILSFVGLLTGLGGLLLNAAVEHLVLGMGTFLGGVLNEPLNLVWTMVRDVVNLTFIFGLIYAGILMILGIDPGKAKKLVASIVVSALLVNFSLFISKVVIDVSNLASVHIYATMTKENGQFDDWNTVGLSGAFMGQMGLLRLANPSLSANPALLVNSGGSNPGDGERSLPYVLIAAIFLIVAAFVFAAGALLLAIRFGLLILLMVLSPVAFVSSLLPGLGGISKKWWNTLFSQAFFAPAYLFLLFLAWKLIDEANVSGLSQDGLVGIFSAGGLAAAGRTVILFVILIVMLVAALVIAKQMGAYGASAALSVGNKARKSVQGALGRNSIGWGANKLGELNNRMEGSRTGRNFKRALSVASLGMLDERGRRNVVKAGKTATFGSKYSYEDNKNFAKEVKKTRTIEERKGKQQDAYNYLTDPNAAADAALTPEQRAEAEKTFIKHIQGMTAAELEELGAEKLEKIALHLTNKQMDQIKDSKEGFDDKEKEGVKEARKKAQLDAFGFDKNREVVDATKADRFLTGMKAADIAKLPAEILTRVEAARHLEGEVLRRIADDDSLNKAQWDQIRANHKAPRQEPSKDGDAPASAKAFYNGPRGRLV